MGGILAGLLGVGGGIIFLPSLIFLLPSQNNEYNATLVPIATSLFAGMFASISSAVKHLAIKNALIKEAVIISAASVSFGFLMPLFVVQIDPSILKYVITSVLLIVAIDMAFKSEKSYKPVLRLSKRYLIPAGIITGIFSAITGLGGGIIIVPLLIYAFGIETKRAIGTSAIVVAFTMIASSVSYATVSDTGAVVPGHLGYVNLPAGSLMGICAVLGAFLGANINLTIKTARIKNLFSILLLVVIIKLLLN